MTKKPAIIVDIDGTISDHQHRLHYVEAKQYDKYYSLCGDDKPKQLIINVVNQYYGDFVIILLTGRPETYRKITELWLAFNKVNYDLLFMRPEGDFRKDCIYKENFYHKFIESKYDVKRCFDDKDSNLNMFKGLGLNVTKVV